MTEQLNILMLKQNVFNQTKHTIHIPIGFLNILWDTRLLTQIGNNFFLILKTNKSMCTEALQKT